MVAELATQRSIKIFSELEDCRKTWNEERSSLIAALHDAIRQPLGVVPDSAKDFYDSTQALTASSPSGVSDPNRSRLSDNPR